VRARFTQIPTAVLRAAGLPCGARLLYSLLRAYAWQDATCWPRQEHLARHLAPDTSVRTVQRLLTTLRAAGWITAQRARGQMVYTCLAPLPAGGFVQVPTQVLTNGRLSSGARILYGVLLSYSRRGGACFPGQARLSADLGITGTRTIRRWLGELAAEGLLRWERGGRGQTNHYQILPTPIAPQPVERSPLSRRGGGEGTAPGAPLDFSAPTQATEPTATDTTAVSAKIDTAEPDPINSIDSKAQRQTSDTRKTAPHRRQLQAYIADIARELGDDAPLPSSVSRAYNLFQHSGWSLEAFVALLLEARRVTQRHAAGVYTARRSGGVGDGRKNKMPYFFAVVAHRLAETPPQPAPRSTVSAPPRVLRATRLRGPRTGRVGSVARPLLPPAESAPAACTAPDAGAGGRYSPLIAGTALEAAQALAEARAPRAADEALLLWQQSGLSETMFLRCMSQARAATRPAFGAGTPFRDALRALVGAVA
jgi:hypothetical protein